jgi:transcriptional regulator with XRE-family HTH domain
MISVTDQTKSLFAKTKALLDQRTPLTLREVAEGSGVGLEWLRKFHHGHIERPDVDRVEKVQQYLLDFEAAKRFNQRQGEARA